MFVTSEMFNEFRKFKALAYKESGSHITTLRSDNVGKLYSKGFNSFFVNMELREFTTHYIQLLWHYLILGNILILRLMQGFQWEPFSTQGGYWLATIPNKFQVQFWTILHIIV